MTTQIRGIYVGRTCVMLEVDKDGLYTASISTRDSREAGSRTQKEYTSYDKRRAMDAFRRYKREVVA